MTDLVTKRTRELFKELGAPCNCGGPQSGTKHSPDCEMLLSWDHLRDVAEDEIADEIADEYKEAT